MSTVPFAASNPSMFGTHTDPFLFNFGNNNQFGSLPFDFNNIGGSNNGLSLSGAWASGGFGGASPTSGFSSFSGTNSGTPNFGLFGLPSSTFPAFQVPGSSGGTIPFSGAATSPHANNNFGFNPSTGLPTFGNPGVGAQASTQGPFPQIETNTLKKLYGNGVGGALSQFLNTGAGFNSQVIQAEEAQAMPLEARTIGRLQDMYGNMGSAYSSTAALGIGDFESQFNAALAGEFAQQYQQSVQNYIDVLMKVAPGAQQQQAQGSSWLGALSGIAQQALSFIPGI